MDSLVGWYLPIYQRHGVWFSVGTCGVLESRSVIMMWVASQAGYVTFKFYVVIVTSRLPPAPVLGQLTISLPPNYRVTL